MASEAEKQIEGTDTASHWYTWAGCPLKYQRAVLAWFAARSWTACLHPLPLLMIQSADRQVQQDVCKAWREHLDDRYDCRTVVSFGERSIVIWFDQMPAPLVEV